MQDLVQKSTRLSDWHTGKAQQMIVQRLRGLMAGGNSIVVYVNSDARCCVEGQRSETSENLLPQLYIEVLKHAQRFSPLVHIDFHLFQYNVLLFIHRSNKVQQSLQIKRTPLKNLVSQLTLLKCANIIMCLLKHTTTTNSEGRLLTEVNNTILGTIFMPPQDLRLRRPIE